MQIQNFNQDEPYRKRRCISYKPNDIFEPFQQATTLIIQNYQKHSQSLLVSGLAILVGKIRSMDKQSYIHSSPINMKKRKQDLFDVPAKQMFTYKKQLPSSFNQDQQEEQTNPEQQIHQMVVLQKTGKKPEKSKKKVQFCLPEKDMANQISKTKKHQKLIKSLNKLSMSDQLLQIDKDFQNIPNIENRNQKDDRQQSDLMKFDEDNLKNKTITQLLQASAKKVKQNQMKKNLVDQDSESEYQITDHSSNQSDSDDQKYQEKYIYQKEEPLLGTIFGNIGKHIMNGKNFFNKNTQSNMFSSKLNPPKLNFKSLLNSPKKTKSKKKRLFINKKKVPRWAQNFQQVQRQFDTFEQIDFRQNSEKIYGICTIQNIQTNTIFDLKDQYTRASTAKWQKTKNGFVI